MTEPAAAGAVPLGWTHLAVAAGLVVVAGAVSLALRLDLEKRLAIASARAMVQLLLIGYILHWVFGLGASLWLALIIGVMLFAASHSAVQRPTRTFHGALWRAFITLTLTGLITTVVVTGVIIRVDPWYRPQYLIPLLGMVLGNGLTGISLCLDQVLETLAERRAEVEMELALGANRWEAARDPLAGAIRRGMIPIINSMMVVGIVSLPGMMTGQILANANPFDAAKYQIVVMFMMAAATALGCTGIALFVYFRMFNRRHQLESHRIRKQAG